MIPLKAACGKDFVSQSKGNHPKRCNRGREYKCFVEKSVFKIFRKSFRENRIRHWPDTFLKQLISGLYCDTA